MNIIDLLVKKANKLANVKEGDRITLIDVECDRILSGVVGDISDGVISVSSGGFLVKIQAFNGCASDGTPYFACIPNDAPVCRSAIRLYAQARVVHVDRRALVRLRRATKQLMEDLDYDTDNT